MRAKRIVVAAALVALVSGGAAMAADGRTAGDKNPVAKTGGTDVIQVHDDGLRVARFRARWDQVRYIPPENPLISGNACTTSPLLMMLADAMGLEDIVMRCEPTD